MAELNGDTKVILHRLDQLGTQLTGLDAKVEQYHVDTQARLHQCEIQTALLEQSNKAICEDIDEQDKDINKLDDKVESIKLLTRIFGGLSGFLSVVAAIIAILAAVTGS